MTSAESDDISFLTTDRQGRVGTKISMMWIQKYVWKYTSPQHFLNTTNKITMQVIH